MLYRLSYERIFSDLQILPNNITTPAPKKQEESAKKCLSAACNIKCERTNTTSNDGYAFYRIYFFTINRAKTQ